MRSGAFDEHEEHVEEQAPRPDAMRWRVSPGLTALKCGITAALVLVAVLFAADRRALACAVIAAVVIGGYALRDLLAPVRLAADRAGLTVVTGYAGRRTLAWSQVERLRLEARTRGGLRSELVEIDTGDYLYLLSMYDLNARPADVLDDLERIRASAA